MKRLSSLLLIAAAAAVLMSRIYSQPESEAAGAVLDASRFANLQAALDALPETGGLVRIPPGRFELERPLLLEKENTKLEGSGPGTLLVNRNTAGEPALMVRNKERATNPRARIWRIELANFRISGNPESGDGILLEGVNELYLHGLTVERNGANGIHLKDCYENPRVIGCNLTYNGKAGLAITGGHDIVVSANEFEENQNAVRCIDSFNLCMTGNNLDDHLSDGIIIENTYGSIVSSNMIEESAGWAIVLDRDCYGITLASNAIAHNYGGIDLRDAWGCSVSSNTFTIVPTHSLRIGPGSGRIAVTGNTFSNSWIGGQTRRAADPAAEWPRMSDASGVLLEGTSDVTLTGNIFSGLVDPAVQTRGECRRIALSGNVAVEVNQRATGTREAFDLKGADPVNAQGNIESLAHGSR